MEFITAVSWIASNLTITTVPLFILCLSAIWFYGYAIYAAISFRKTPRTDNATFCPPVTILKPICGLEESTYANLASFCCQDYPAYQVIFAVRDAADPVIAIVQALMRDFPTLDLRLLVSDRTLGTNPKVSNLVNAVTVAHHPILVLADSDIRVTPDYLRRVVQPLHDPKVGVVTCLYRSLPHGWVTTLEALGVATEFHAGVLVSRKLSGMTFGLGSTIVIRQKTLEAIGGFEAIANYLADDFLLGHLPTHHGYKVVLSDYIVNHVLTRTTTARSLQRQTRWARGTRMCQPAGYLGLIFTYGTVTSLLLLLATGASTFGWAMLGITWFVRLVMAWVIGAAILQDPTAKRYLWLVPLRDLLSFAIWCHSFGGNSVEWRGQYLRLDKGGKLVPLVEGDRHFRTKVTAH